MDDKRTGEDEKPQAPDHERDPAGPVSTRGNPDLEPGLVEQGEEKLDRIVGN